MRYIAYHMIRTMTYQALYMIRYPISIFSRITGNMASQRANKIVAIGCPVWDLRLYTLWSFIWLYTSLLGSIILVHISMRLYRPIWHCTSRMLYCIAQINNLMPATPAIAGSRFLSLLRHSSYSHHIWSHFSSPHLTSPHIISSHIAIITSLSSSHLILSHLSSILLVYLCHISFSSSHLIRGPHARPC